MRPVLLAIAAIPLIVAIPSGLAIALGNNRTFAFMLAGSHVLHLASRPSRREIGVTLGIAAAGGWAYRATLGFGGYWGAEVMQWGAFLGVASLLVVGFQTALARGAECERRAKDFLWCSVTPYIWILVGFLLPLTARWGPLAWDPALLLFDSHLGFQQNALVRAVQGDALAWRLTGIAYEVLALGIALALAHNRREAGGVNLLGLTASCSLCGYLLFWAFPAVGPAYAFAGFPLEHPLGRAAAQIPAVAMAPRNAMPSLHMTAALLVAWNTRRCFWPGRIAALLLVAGTVFSTLALGEHYVVDLVVAAPYALAFQAAWTAPAALREGRLSAILAGGGMVAGWLALLRFGAGWFNTGVSWCLVLCTLAATGALAIRLGRAEAAHRRSPATRRASVS